MNFLTSLACIILAITSPESYSSLVKAAVAANGNKAAAMVVNFILATTSARLDIRWQCRVHGRALLPLYIFPRSTQPLAGMHCGRMPCSKIELPRSPLTFLSQVAFHAVPGQHTSISSLPPAP